MRELFYGCSKHNGGTLTKNIINATCGTDGYSGTKYCLGCDAKLQSSDTNNNDTNNSDTNNNDTINSNTNNSNTNTNTPDLTGLFAINEGCYFVLDGEDVRGYRGSDGSKVIDEFRCDGKYTYYFQADGTAMRDRLTYHPDGDPKHIIYFEQYGHEVFSNFANVKRTIAGELVYRSTLGNAINCPLINSLTYN